VPRPRWAMGDRVDAAPTFERVLSRRQPRTDTPAALKRPSDLLFPANAMGGAPLPVHALHKLMARYIVSYLVQDNLPPDQAEQLAQEILGSVKDLQSLHRAIADVAARHRG